jgi:site-specific DNA-methyltransferase (adenine-specific)
MTDKDIKLENAHILFGDALARLKELPDNSVDSIVTDPPYGLTNTKGDLIAKMITEWVNGDRSFVPDAKGFMGKEWDGSVPPPAIWDECLRVLKPGGHLLAFFGSRTQDIGALSIRLAGFEIRDSIAWVYGSGFPKSLDVSKAIDKASGAEREVIGKNPNHRNTSHRTNDNPMGQAIGAKFITGPATPEAQQWQGWGTALKPAFEPVIVARKPIEGTVANNVLKWGTGGLNIDESRIGTETIINNGMSSLGVMHDDNWQPKEVQNIATGRFPANIILDETTAAMLDEQSGVSGTSTTKLYDGPASQNVNVGGGQINIRHNDTGGASRFFYVAKASKKDRNEGLEGLPEVKGNDIQNRKEGSAGSKNPRAGIGAGSATADGNTPRQNFHPTVKPTKLMEYLIKLVTPVGGTVLDPFAGSGSTGKAALLNGFKFVGCELTEEYLPIIKGRLNWAENKYNEEVALKEKEAAETLFETEGDK